MIEVEKRFQPTNEQLTAMLEGAQFIGEKVNHDNLYDYEDYRLLKEDIRLRKRNEVFELKIGQSKGVSEEIVERQVIEKYFNTENLEGFIKNNLIEATDYSTKRRTYKKEGFTIDIDELSFGYKVCEIEILVNAEEEVKKAEDKIINFAKKYNFEFKKLPSKREEYFRIVKPEVYKILYNK